MSRNKKLSAEVTLGKSGLWMLVFFVCSGCFSATKTPALVPELARPLIEKEKDVSTQPQVIALPAQEPVRDAQSVPIADPRSAQEREEQRLYAEDIGKTAICILAS